MKGLTQSYTEQNIVNAREERVLNTIMISMRALLVPGVARSQTRAGDEILQCDTKNTQAPRMRFFVRGLERKRSQSPCAAVPCLRVMHTRTHAKLTAVRKGVLRFVYRAAGEPLNVH